MAGRDILKFRKPWNLHETGVLYEKAECLA